jgi:[ribosomal protein S5]-alanine N-acetyltransferase
MAIIAETQNLILREIEHSDLDAFYEMERHAEVHHYLFSEAATNKEDIEKAIVYIRSQYDQNGIGRWAVIEKLSEKFIGWSGIKFVTDAVDDRRNFYDIGYRLHPYFWNKGYATESALFGMHYAENVMNLDGIYGIADKNNLASRRVLEKIGLEFQNEFIENDTTLCWYKKTF